ncbi:hypothetical protein [Spirochaeta dissipatitropha]
MKRILTILLVVFFTGSIFAQNQVSLSDSYIRDFRNSEGGVRFQILESSLEYEPQELTRFYLDVLDFILGNAGDRINDNSSRNLYNLAVDRLAAAGTNEPALRVWDLFTLDRDSSQRIRLLESMTVFGVDAPRLHTRLADWIKTQNTLLRSGVQIDRQVLGQAVMTAASLQNTVFFEAFLHTVISSHPLTIDQPAREGILAFGDRQVELLKTVIPREEVSLQIEMLAYVSRRDDLDPDLKAEIAQAVLRTAVDRHHAPATDVMMNRRLRSDATGIIAAAGYSPASREIIEHFNISLSDYDNRRITIADLLDSINAMGAIGTQDAAVRLSRYLDNLNTSTQNDRPVSTQIMLAVVNNLGRLGFEEAYNALFYATMLNYPARVKTALNEAISQVQQ